jgi:hypothetical protein
MNVTDLREEISHVLESGALQQSAVLRRILEYLGEAAAQGKDDLKEYTIGVEALGKSASYDPQRDSTVRVHVGKLRQKLDEYYRDQGAEHRLRISLPKGTFRLQLESQQNGAPPEEKSRPNFRRYLIPVAAGLLIAVLFYLLGARKSARAGASEAGLAWTPELRLFWQPIVGNGMPIIISYDVAMTIELPPWKIRNPNINTPEELAGSKEWQELSDKLGHPAVHTEYPYVGFGIAQGTYLLSQLMTSQKVQPLVKRSTILSWEDIARSHLIFIGTGKNAKIRHILEHGDFQWDLNKITNLKPQAGEPREFPSVFDSRSGEYREQYALISMLPGFDSSTRILILGGGISEGDWGAVEYVTLPDHVSELVRQLKTSAGDLPKAFQVVVRITYESRVPVTINYVTHHVLSIPGGLRRESDPK